MIVNLYVAVDLAIALFAIAVGSYAALKAYKVDAGFKAAQGDQRYELEKDYYLVSTVGWMTLGTRIMAIPLFFISVISLIPAVPGAMCEYGVMQAGAPYSWADLAVKLFTMFAFGGWLFVDFMNRKLKGSPLIGSLSRGFFMLMPLLFVDALLDIAFFGSLQPLVVPCCMIAYSNTAGGLFNIGCPFCFVTYKYPLLWGVIPAFALAVAIMIWSFMFTRTSRGFNVQKESSPLLKKALTASIILAVVGTLLLLFQVVLGPFSSI
jgi:hypothetical protein